MNKIQLYVCMLLCMQLMLAGCSDSDYNSSDSTDRVPDFGIQVQVSSLTFDSEGGSREVQVTAGGNWTATVDQSSWCKVIVGTDRATIEVTKNSGDKERNTKVEFSCGGEKTTLTVTQKGQKTLLLTSSKVSVSSKEQTINVSVKSSVNYTFKIEKSASDWITSMDTCAVTNRTHTFKIARNTTSQKREGKILFMGEGISETLHIYQDGEGEPQLILTQNEYTVSASRTDIRIELKSNTDYEMIFPDVEWLHVNPSRAMSTYTVYVTADENISPEMRSTRIQFVYGNTTEEVTIIQQGKGPVDADKDIYGFDAAGGIVNVKVDADVSYTVEMPDWITQKSGSDPAGNGITFIIQKNPTLDLRQGKITFKVGTQEQVITVIQRGFSLLHLYTVPDVSFAAIPTFTSSNTLSGKVIWGDGFTEPFKQKAEHTYQQSSSYEITIELESTQHIHLDRISGYSGINLSHF